MNVSENEVQPMPEPDAADAAAESLDQDLQALADTLQKITDERDALKDQLLRTMADFQNFRKRQEEQRRALEHAAAERVVTGLLPVLDNFERAIASAEKGATIESFTEGIRAVERQFRSVLEGLGVARIDAVGQPFDPELHEALATVETNEHPEDTIADELEPGYRLGERVIRPARVRVAKKP